VYFCSNLICEEGKQEYLSDLRRVRYDTYFVVLITRLLSSIDDQWGSKSLEDEQADKVVCVDAMIYLGT